MYNVRLALLFVTFVTHSLFVTAQSSTDAQVAILNHELKTLKQENAQLKKELAAQNNTLNAGLDSIQQLYQTADNKINLQKMLLAGTIEGTIAQLAEGQQQANDRLNRHRSIIQTSLVLGLLAILIFASLLVWLIISYKKHLDKLRKNLYENETMLHENKKAFSVLSVQLTELKDDLLVYQKATGNLSNKLAESKIQIMGELQTTNDELNKKWQQAAATVSKQDDTMKRLGSRMDDLKSSIEKETAAQLKSQVINLKSDMEAQITALQKTIHVKNN